MIYNYIRQSIRSSISLSFPYFLASKFPLSGYATISCYGCTKHNDHFTNTSLTVHTPIPPHRTPTTKILERTTNGIRSFATSKNNIFQAPVFLRIWIFSSDMHDSTVGSVFKRTIYVSYTPPAVFNHQPAKATLGGEKDPFYDTDGWKGMGVGVGGVEEEGYGCRAIVKRKEEVVYRGHHCHKNG